MVYTIVLCLENNCNLVLVYVRSLIKMILFINNRIEFTINKISYIGFGVVSSCQLWYLFFYTQIKPQSVNVVTRISCSLPHLVPIKMLW